MKLKILTEGSGSLVSAYLIKAIQSAGHYAVASDVTSDSVGRYLADEFVLMPRVQDESLWGKVDELLKRHSIDVVIPSFDETLEGWAERKEHYQEMGVTVICSNLSTIRTFQDKWLTYQFFKRCGIPTPKTSLRQEYSLVKPRHGRGARGVRVVSEPVSMEGNITQEVVLGQEYTVDVLCNKNSEPLYIVPRTREGVKEGKSTGGEVTFSPEITDWIKYICRHINFHGPINMQCFVCDDGNVKFIEINPRIAGGMALGFAATENWIPLLIRDFVYNEEIGCLKPVQYKMKMRRYYAEVFVPPH